MLSEAAEAIKLNSIKGGVQLKSIKIKDTTREERIEIINQALSVCGGGCDFCNGCDNIGGGRVDDLYQPYIDGWKEISEINMEYSRRTVRG